MEDLDLATILGAGGFVAIVGLVIWALSVRQARRHPGRKSETYWGGDFDAGSGDGGGGD